MPFFPEAFTEGLSVHSSGGHHRRSSSRHRTSKRRRSRSSSRDRDRDRDRGAGSFVSDLFGKDSNYSKHNASRGSFFGLPLGNSSRGSFFPFGGGNSRSSYYKRSPRKGFMQRAYKQLKRLIRDLIHWFKRHPWKVFFKVIMPLVTGGALTALLARFGLRIPPSLERALGMASRAASGDGFGLVSDAVRMAGGGGAGHASTRGGFGSSSSSYYDSYTRHGGSGFGDFQGFGHARSSHGSGGDDWANGLVNGVAKMFR
ncbi:hypothetical protein IF1G_02085 [Cordyceps javanica]|uniref:Uncharacterized protein n=1 Tax=Cordyceps javanica TaxID=43265 RepID=A0A545VDS0_9HYPO|nr:hypothetical protein IF1G_02085 [Cordyceps javanica]TQW10456.1 hypothetical protein IF2G_01398 [Cordyceps javanica]